MKFSSLVAACGIGLSLAANCRASVVTFAWEFNPATQTAALVGTTDSLTTPFDFGSGSVVSWFLEVTIPGGTSSFASTAGTATYDSPTPISISNDPNNSGAGYVAAFFPFDPSFLLYQLSINGNTPPAPATISGGGASIDYSSWSPAVKSYLESFSISSPLVMPSDQTTTNLLVYAVAVPEASSFLCGSLIGVGLIGRCVWTKWNGATVAPCAHEAAS